MTASDGALEAAAAGAWSVGMCRFGVPHPVARAIEPEDIIFPAHALCRLPCRQHEKHYRMPLTAQTTGRVSVLSNSRVRLEVRADAPVTVTVSATRGNAWVPVLCRSGTNRSVDGAFRIAVAEGPRVETVRLKNSACLVIRGRTPAGMLCIAAWLYQEEPWIEITETLTVADRRAGAVAELKAEWSMVRWQEPGEVFSPHLVPEEGDIVGLHCLRSPALAAQSGAVAAALVADPSMLAKRQALPGFMCLLRDNGMPVLQTGLVGQELRGHVFFRATFEPARADSFYHSYALYVGADEPPGAALDAARRRLWRSHGARAFRAAVPPKAAAEELGREIYPRALATRWREQNIGGARAGAITTDRAFPGDVWMCPWFHNLCSAYGLYVWGERSGVREWVDRALAIRELHLAAPVDRGLFPTLFVFGDDGGQGTWYGSHPQGGAPNVLHVADMSYTLYLLLLFHRDLTPDNRTVDRALEYCDALLSLERPGGALPAYVSCDRHETVTHVDPAAWRALLAERPGGDRYISMSLDRWGSERFVESAEDAASLMLLVEVLRLPGLDPQARERIAALAGRVGDGLIERVVTPAWYVDMEVYWSCAPNALGFYDKRSGQHPQSLLALWMCANGLLGLFETTKRGQYRDAAMRAMNRLCLYQQVYDPPFLRFDGFGGYGAQNTDGEWSDARQALIAMTHLDFYRVTGDEEHRERAQAACRASFSTLFHPAVVSQYPTGWCRTPVGLAAENHAHGGRDMLCGVSSFHWGAGSALTAVAYFVKRGMAPWQGHD